MEYTCHRYAYFHPVAEKIDSKQPTLRYIPANSLDFKDKEKNWMGSLSKIPSHIFKGGAL